MKIAFVGKGGSGKTTVSSLFIRYLASRDLPVVAIDADINQHLGVALGLSQEAADAVPALGQHLDELKELLKGDNSHIDEAQYMVKTTPPGPGSTLVGVQADSPVMQRFATPINGVRLLASGPFADDDIGLRCYHNKQGSAELLLNHIVDSQREYVVVDMTAGADSFASGLFAKFDLTFLVVEPTLKSVAVYNQYQRYAKDYDLTIKVIGNKVEDDSDVAFLRQHVGGDLVGWLGRSGYVRSMEKGEVQPLGALEPAGHRLLEALLKTVDAVPKNSDKLYRHTVDIHRRYAAARPAPADVTRLLAQVDPDFSLAAAGR